MQSKRKQHSEAFKKKLVSLKLAGASASELGAKYGVNPNQIHKWANDDRWSKGAAPTGRKGKAVANENDDISKIVDKLMAGWRQTLDVTLRQLVDLAVQRRYEQGIDAALRTARDNITNALKSRRAA